MTVADSLNALQSAEQTTEYKVSLLRGKGDPCADFRRVRKIAKSDC